MLAIVKDCLIRNFQLCISSKFMPRIGIAIPAREIAARYVQTNAVPSPEDIAGCPEIDLVFVGSPWLNQRCSFPVCKTSISSADNTIGKILRIAIGVNIYQACHKIGICRAGNGPKMYFDRASHLEILF